MPTIASQAAPSCHRASVHGGLSPPRRNRFPSAIHTSRRTSAVWLATRSWQPARWPSCSRCRFRRSTSSLGAGSFPPVGSDARGCFRRRRATETGYTHAGRVRLEWVGGAWEQ